MERQENLRVDQSNSDKAENLSQEKVLIEQEELLIEREKLLVDQSNKTRVECLAEFNYLLHRTGFLQVDKSVLNCLHIR